jgi:hypothetical protein
MKTDVDVLVAHQRMNMRSCGCGWDDLGRSHAEHVAAALASARALRGEVVVRLADVEDAISCPTPLHRILALQRLADYLDAHGVPKASNA